MSTPSDATGAHAIQKRGGLKAVRQLGLGVLTEIQNGSQKRKRGLAEEFIDNSDLGGAFTIQPPPNSSTPSVTLSPKLFVSRQQLPLYFISTSAKQNSIVGRLFRGHIAAFKSQESELSRTIQQTVLIAQVVGEESLFALEAVQDGIYVFCPLQAWVSMDDFERRPAKTQKQSESTNLSFPTANPWWRSSSIVASNFKEPKTRVKSPKLLSEFRLSMKPPPDTSSLKQDGPLKCTASAKLFGTQNESSDSHQKLALVAPKASEVMTPESLANMIRAQYLEALYVSKTSLAYFAKGPLSRARAAIQGSAEIKSFDLGNCLRACILKVAMINKKYPATMIEIIKEIPSGIAPEDFATALDGPLGARVRKSRKRKKTTKEGLYAHEEEYIVRWWLNQEASQETTGGPDDTRESRIKIALSEQRARETQLQIILILEVFALEAQVAKEQQNPLPEIGTDDKQPNTPAKRVNKKHQDISSILDVLIDRLCIWESMNMEGAKETKPTKLDGNGSARDTDSGRLRDFCTEVVVPFYATRLPDLYSTICQKLGASGFASPQTSIKTPAVKKTTKPGAPMQRPVPPKLKKSSSSHNPSNSRRPLSRSATDTQLIKRELTPAIDLASMPAHRPVLTATQRYEKREVDLAAVSQATEAKLARKAAQEQELRGAIAALRRPNARMAVKDYIEEQDRRAGLGVKGSSNKRKGNPVRNPFADGVQVVATPKIRRMGAPRGNSQASQVQTQNAYGGFLQQEPEVILPSSDPRVPSSTLKPTTQVHVVGVTPSKPALAQTRLFPHMGVDKGVMESSPSKRMNERTKISSLAAVLEDDDGETDGEAEPEPELPFLKIPAQRPRKELVASLSGTPSKRQKSITFAVETPSKIGGENRGRNAVVPTSAVSRDVDPPKSARAETKVPFSKESEEMETDIYAALGWNDDYDL